MKELIKVNYSSERPTVNGRDLYEALEVKTAYKELQVAVEGLVKSLEGGVSHEGNDSNE